MSRQFNFMPSRYASRTVTPRHGDASRTERDEMRTECGQDADKTRTTGAVPRDKSGTDPGQTRDNTVTEEERDEARTAAWAAERLVQRLGELRIMGRHADKPAPLCDIAYWCRELGIPVEKGRSAYEAGRQDRARGVRCMCVTCLGQRAYEGETADHENNMGEHLER